jgi:hypothetical protein
MTFRDFTKIVRKDTDIFSEHNYSIISGKDIENINDITIKFSEERKSDAFKDQALTCMIESEQNNIDKKEAGQLLECPNLYLGSKQLNFVSEMDDFLTKNNAIINIKF